MKRKILIILSLTAALFIGNQILLWVEKYLSTRPTHFVFEMPGELPKMVAERFGTPLKVKTDKVYLVGSFNDWGLGKSVNPGYEMKRVSENKWVYDIELSTGFYRYKFRFVPTNATVTKNQAPNETGFIWIWDLKSKHIVADGFEQFNSFVHVSNYWLQKIRNIWKWALIGIISIFLLGLLVEWLSEKFFSFSLPFRWKIFSLLTLEFLILSGFFLFLIVRGIGRSLRMHDSSLVNNILLLAKDQLQSALANPENGVPLYEQYQEPLFVDGIRLPSENILEGLKVINVALYDESGHLLLNGFNTKKYPRQYFQPTWETFRSVDCTNVDGITYGFFISRLESLPYGSMISTDPIEWIYGPNFKSYFVPLTKFGYPQQFIFTLRLVWEMTREWQWLHPFPFHCFIAPISIDKNKGYLLLNYKWAGVERIDVLGEIIIWYVGLFIFFSVVIVFSTLTVSRVIVNPIRNLSSAMRKVSRGDLTTSVIISTKDEIQKLGDAFNDMVHGLRERELIKSAFGRYVSKQVAEKILKEPDKLEMVGERREVSIIFADIRNFTPYSETHTPEEVVQTLNEYFSKMIDIIFKYEGTLDKFIGDCVMAVFGAPLDQPDHAERAVKCAWEMQHILDKINLERISMKEMPIKIGIGVNSGEVVSGNVGSDRRMEFSVVGDSVNLASRLEDLAKEGQILIGPGTYEKVKNIVDAKPLPPQTVKGKSEPVKLYEVISLKEPSV